MNAYIAGNSKQKGSVDLKASMWLRNSIVLIVLGPYNGSIQLTLCATIQSPRRLHMATTAFILQVPFFICRYLLLNIQVPFSTHQQSIHGTVLFTPDILTPHKPFWAFPRLYQYSETILRTFSTHEHTQSLPRPRDAASINENWTLTERRVRHLERKVPGRYLLSHHTVIPQCYTI